MSNNNQTEPVYLTDAQGNRVGTAGAPLVVTGAAVIGGTVTQGNPNAGGVLAWPVVLAASTLRVGGTYPVGGALIDEVPTVRTVQRSSITASAAGATEVVPAQGAGVRIRVLAVFVASSSAIGVKFQSAATDISGLSALSATGGFVMPETQHGWFQTAANEALNVNLSGAATSVGVTVIWVQAT